MYYVKLHYRVQIFANTTSTMSVPRNNQISFNLENRVIFENWASTPKTRQDIWIKNSVVHKPAGIQEMANTAEL